MAVQVPVNMLLNFDFALEHKVRRAAEANIGEFAAGFAETDFQCLAALDLHPYR